MQPDSDTISMMAIERLPMGAKGTDSGILNGEEQQASRPTNEWVPGLQEAMTIEDLESMRVHPPSQPENVLGASCPLQRWMFYSGGYTPFSPEIPSALRAQHIFHGIHRGKMSHPTMVRAVRGEFLGNYRSPNGFCACPVVPDIDQTQCRIPSDADSTQACSLAQTIKALKAVPGDVFDTYVFPPLDHKHSTHRCKMQLDWPEVSGQMRDGSEHQGDWSMASSPTHRECHILDRFLPFRYQYQRSTKPPTRASDGKTTVNAGVCQTARVVTLRREELPPTATRCLRTSAFTPTSDQAEFTCDVPVPTMSSPTMPRRRRLNKDETLVRQRARRQRCNQCAPPPRFESEKGRAIPAESSFGKLYRLSVERMLAKDLQDALSLGNGTDQVHLNASAWLPGEFMRNYMFSPGQLFRKPGDQAGGAAVKQSLHATTSKDATWTPTDPAHGWVYCPTTNALKTGEGCQGSMTRTDWIQRKKTLCPLLVRSYSTAAATGKDPMARTPFCNLDNSTDLVCKALEEAKGLVTQANCIASGADDCMPSPYVYHPASYVHSNNAWVHDSVEAFYLKVDAGSCPISSNSAQKQQDMLEFARTYQLTCPANALTLVKQILMAVRVIVTDITLLIASFMSMGVKLLALLVTGNTNKIKNSILSDWEYIQAKGTGMLHSVSDLLVDGMLNSGTLGLRIKHFLENTCSKINSALNWFLQVW